MSASTPTVQRTLGTSQLGGMIVLLAVLAAIVATIAIGSLGATKADAPAVGAAANPIVDFVPRHEISGTPKQVAGYWQPDGRGGLEFIQTPVKDTTPVSYGGWNGPRLTATDHSNGSILGPRLQAR